MQILTIGHSNHSLEYFYELLEHNNIDVVVDVRSQPFSRYAIHFCQGPLQESIRKTQYKYLYLGKELGGMPKDPQFHDDEGVVDFERIAASEPFQTALARVTNGLAMGYRLALMCGEENPTHCHRRLLLGAQLMKRGCSVAHIRGNKTLLDENELLELEQPKSKQLSLFE